MSEPTAHIRSERLRDALVRLREASRPILPGMIARRMPPDRARIVRLGGVAAYAPDSTRGIDELFHMKGKPQPRPAPEGGYPSRWTALEAARSPHHCSRQVARLSNASVSGLVPAVVSADGALIYEFSCVLEEPIDRHPTFRRVRLPARSRLSGRTLLLAYGHSGNFFHWMNDTLPRLRLVEHAGHALGSFDHLLIPGSAGTFVHESLSAFPELRAVRHELNDATHFECQELVCATSLHPPFESSQWAVAVLRRRLMTRERPSAGGARVYLGRGRAGRRRLLNEAELWKRVLEPAGFTRLDIDGCSLASQIAAVSNAAVVAAPHGAALTHMVFARPGASIIELLPDALPAPYFWNLSGAMAHRYRYVVGASQQTGEIGNIVDFEVDSRDLAACLDDTLAELDPHRSPPVLDTRIS